MKKKEIIITYDYELFFGENSGTILGSVVNPTYIILDEMKKNNQKGVFFVDWQMLKYLNSEKSERTQSDYNLIVEQLKYMLENGHRIELHIHPHWIDAKYNGDGTWNFAEFRHYSLNSFSENEVIELFIEGTKLLENIAHQVDPHYKIVAFRAGGWAVQPFEKVRKGMLSSGIRIDSSVAYGTCAFNKTYSFDFRSAPDIEKGYYFIDNDVCKISNEGIIIEVPITTYRKRILYKIIDRIVNFNKNNFRCLTDGSHIRNDKNISGRNIRQYTRMYLYLTSYFNILIEVIFTRKNIICFNDHPKDLTIMTLKCLKMISYFTNSIDYRYFLENEDN